MQADILHQLNSSIDKIYTLLDNQFEANQLNSSVDTIYSLLDNRINQLNWSIDHLHQQIKSVSDNNTLELDNTDSALQSYIIQVNSALANQLNSTEMMYRRLFLSSSTEQTNYSNFILVQLYCPPPPLDTIGFQPPMALLCVCTVT